MARVSESAPALARQVLLLGTYVMPDRTPAALRAVGLATALRGAGYDCSFGAGEIWADGAWRPEGHMDVVGGFPVVSLAELGGPTTSRWVRAKAGMFLAGRGARRWLASRDLSGVAAVIANGGYSPLMLRLLPLLRGRGVPLVVDIADWYDPWHQPGGPFTPFSWQIELAMRVLHKSCDGVIAVSSYLESYYEAPSRPTVRVPPTTDTSQRKWLDALESSPKDDEKLRIVYAGTPGKKDDLRMVVESASRARREAGPIRLTFIGPDREAIRGALPVGLRADLDALDARFPGYVPHEAVPSLLSKNDFSVLVRPRKRYAEAGFPTKLVESLSAGVPMIVNATSDIPEYVRDGVEGYMVPAYSTEALAATFVRAAATPLEARREMRRAARARAVSSFDNRVYSGVLGSLISRVSDAAEARRRA